MAPTPRVVLCIKNKYEQLNPAMKQVADYIISCSDKVVFMGISELAAASGVSIASVTRFVKVIGYKNFKSFQLELAGSLNENQGEYQEPAVSSTITFEYGGASERDNAEEICRKVFNSNQQMLTDTIKTLDFSMIEAVSEHIIKARNVIFFGCGRSHITAESGRTRLYRLGITTLCYNDVHEQIVAATMSDHRDVVIGISNYGRTASVVNCMKLARERGAVTVGLTSAEGSPLAQAVEYLFLTAYNYANLEYRSRNRSYEPACENITQIVLLDCIYMNVALRMDKRCIDQFYETVKELEKERI